MQLILVEGRLDQGLIAFAKLTALDHGGGTAVQSILAGCLYRSRVIDVDRVAIALSKGITHFINIFAI